MGCINGHMVKSNLVISLVPYIQAWLMEFSITYTFLCFQIPNGSSETNAKATTVVAGATRYCGRFFHYTSASTSAATVCSKSILKKTKIICEKAFHMGRCRGYKFLFEFKVEKI